MSEAIRFPVTGMICGSCVNAITRALRRLDGVDRIKVDLRAETVTLRRQPTVSATLIAEAISKAGYAADLSSATTLADVATASPFARLFRRNA